MDIFWNHTLHPMSAMLHSEIIERELLDLKMCKGGAQKMLNEYFDHEYERI